MRGVFTGLVEERGTLRTRSARGPGARITVGCTLAPLVLGESISVDGVCLTVASIVPGGFEADCSHETLARTTLGKVAMGAGVNLERAVPLGGRMGGHIVSGHVDGEGTIESMQPIGDAVRVDFAVPPELARYVAEKGSIAVNGVSLTVNSVAGNRFSVVIIPHTWEKTTLGAIAAGSKVNLEVDVLARYVARLLEVGQTGQAGQAGHASTDASLLESLARAGFT
jgi:riboflavin synthase